MVSQREAQTMERTLENGHDEIVDLWARYGSTEYAWQPVFLNQYEVP